MSLDRRDESDVSLSLAKRARRRLIGAVALVLLAAIVLPMVMDQAPNRQPESEVQIHIPGQNEAPPFNPPLTPPAEEHAAPAQNAAASPETGVSPPETVPPSSPSASSSTATPTTTTPKPARIEKPAEKTDSKAASTAAPPQAQAAQTAPAAQTAKTAQADAEAKRREAEARRAAAILSGASSDAAAPPQGGGKTATASAAPAGAGQYVIQIGAFSNQTNLKQTQDKLGAVGVKTYTEVISLPKGSVTRLRAGPFPSREAAEKALQKMKSVGVSGDISARS